MSNFKVGDKVRVIQDEGSGWSFDTKGKVYTVVATHMGFIIQHRGGEVSLTTLKNWPHEFELVEEEVEVNTAPKFVNRKFRVRNSKHSRQIQETLFSLGYKWVMHGQQVKYTSHAALFSDMHGHISWGDERCFEQSEFQEAVMVARTLYSIEDVPQKAKPETVELNGLLYLKTDLEAALKQLTPVGGGK